jgi:hypothetical protein
VDHVCFLQYVRRRQVVGQHVAPGEEMHMPDLDASEQQLVHRGACAGYVRQQEVKAASHQHTFLLRRKPSLSVRWAIAGLVSPCVG